MDSSNHTALILGAHPDDAEIRCGGMAAIWRSHGWTVHFVSVTDGSAGHQSLTGQALTEKRSRESDRAASVIGAKTHCMGLPDGGLEPTVDNRLKLVRLVRRLEPDLIVTHRPNDYHPDHRVTSQLMMDASYLLAVPSIAPDVAPMRRRPVICYCWDDFKDPVPFKADIAVDIDPVLPQKLEQMMAHETQFFDWLPWVSGGTADVPADEAGRRDYLAAWLLQRHNPPVAQAYRDVLLSRYGHDHAQGVRYAEAFQICEYGAPADPRAIEQLFPLYPL